jgi:hypothetical protein
VQEGWFVTRGPYGYRNIRKDGRGMVEIDPIPAENVRRIFHLFANGNHTLDTPIEKLAAEGRQFRPSTQKFARSTLYAILKDRTYIGEILHKGQWYPGKHKPLIDRATWDRVQALFEWIRSASCTNLPSKTKSSPTGNNGITGLSRVRRHFRSGTRAPHRDGPGTFVR